LIKNEQIDQLMGFELKHTKVERIKRTWDILLKLDNEIRNDIEIMSESMRFATPDPSNRIMGEEVFIEQGADVRNCIINAEKGPIYVASGALVMEGSMLRGPLYVGPSAVIKMGAKIYGPVALGPYAKVGGELNNVVIQGYSNKGHDGFLGHSVIGEWCNLGADTNNSNLKNNYEEVKLWNYALGKFEPTGQQFCGLIMGDHSKAGINTMFNTGTVVGVSCNIYGSGFPRNFIPSFSWGGASGFTAYRLDKAIDTAKRMMARRDIPFSSADKKIFQHLHKESQSGSI
jgi:UDP-N-acetylglucosamine diphosphorylase/glucosamine-1-phosphate N-acetyltransferase